MSMDEVTFNMLPKEVRDALPEAIRNELEKRDTTFLHLRSGEDVQAFVEGARATVEFAPWQRTVARIGFEALAAIALDGARCADEGNGEGILATFGHLASLVDPDGLARAFCDNKTRAALALLLLVQPADEEIGQSGHATCSAIHAEIDRMIDRMREVVPEDEHAAWEYRFVFGGDE